MTEEKMKAGLPSSPPDPSVTIRCPRLGHQIHFGYCRKENMGHPCFKTLDCWYPHFEVVEFFRSELTEDQFNRAFRVRAAPKMASLVDLIRKAASPSAEGTGQIGDQS